MAMTPTSMQALMQALKMKEQGSSALLPNAKPAATDNMPHTDLSLDAQPTDPDEDSDNDADTNAKIVDILQDQYPRIFAKISSMVEDDPDSGSDLDNDPTQPDPSGGPDTAPV
jgi:hypothetical protein